MIIRVTDSDPYFLSHERGVQPPDPLAIIQDPWCNMRTSCSRGQRELQSRGFVFIGKQLLGALTVGIDKR